MESNLPKERLKYANHFKELQVYQRPYTLSLEVHRRSADFPKTEQYGGVADQMRRASKSICANLAEGFGKKSFVAEWRRFLLMALGSSEEMNVWCDYAMDLGMLERPVGEAWYAEYQAISRILFTMADKAKGRMAA